MAAAMRMQIATCAEKLCGGNAGKSRKMRIGKL